MQRANVWKAAALLVTMGVLLQGAAAVSLTDVSVTPDETLWLSEEFDIAAACEPTSDTYSVYIKNMTQGANVFPAGEDALLFDRIDNQYVITGDEVRSFFDVRSGFKPGKYTFVTACSDDDTTDHVRHSFTVQQLSAKLVSGLSSEVVFPGETRRLSVELKKLGEGSPVIVGKNASPTFKSHIDGNTQQIPHYFDSERQEWVVSPTMPEEAGDYTLKLIAEHRGASATITRDITVQNALLFDASLSKKTVRSDESATLDISMTYKNQDIRVEKEDITVKIAGTDVTDRVTEQSISAGESAFTLSMPTLSPGTYNMTLNVDTENASASKTFELRYPVTIRGDFRNLQDNPVSYTLQFWQDTTRRNEISGNGEYSVDIVPDTYNVTSIFSQADITLENTEVTSWDDALRYESYASGVFGLNTAGLHAFRTASSLSYDAARLTLRYNTQDINNPEKLAVYRCTEWNLEKASCYGTWEEISASFNHVNNRVTVSTTADGAFAIGRRDALQVKYDPSTIQGTYNPNKDISFTGMIKSASGERVQNATVTMRVPGTDISQKTWTDKRGSFDFSFTVPNAADDYTLKISAEKSPYMKGERETRFTVERPAHLKIVSPENIRVTANSSKNLSIYLKNTGFRTITDIQPVTEDVSFLERVSFDRRPLQMNQSRSATLHFDVPADAEAKTHKANLAFEYGKNTASTVFGITVDAPESTQKDSETANSTTALGMVAGGMPSVPSLPSVSLPTDAPFTDVVFAIVLLQVGIIGFYLLRTNEDIQRDQVMDAVSGAVKNRDPADEPEKEDVEGEKEYNRKDGVERQRVMRAMKHIKDEINAKH